MNILADTGILLRLVNNQDLEHIVVRRAFEALLEEGHSFVMTMQNVCEYWSAATRPATSRGGFGLSCQEALSHLNGLEELVAWLPEPPEILEVWSKLIEEHGILGTRAHDTRLAAAMICHDIPSILTLNGRDFRRFTPIVVLDARNLGQERPAEGSNP